jgi:hypothetical protein
MLRLTTPQEKREFEAYVEALFKLDDYAKVHNELAGINVPAPYRLRIKVLYSEISVRNVIDGLVENGSLQHLKEESRTYAFNTTVGRLSPKRLRVPFFVGSFDKNGLRENVQAITAICNTDQWDALRRFSANTYPRLVPILLSQSELIQCAKRLKHVTGHNVIVKGLSAKETFNEKKGAHLKSIRVWTGEELDKALLSIQDRHQIISSLDVEFFQRIGDYAHVLPNVICKIRKNGEIEVTGSYKLAFEAVATQIAKVGERKLSFFSGRGLRISNYEPKPLAVNFVQPVFEKFDTVQNFVQILSKYPHSMHAVLHGNPYAHVKLTDVLDGSSFDIWAISPSRIALLPGLKATEAAYERLIHYIFDKFREGQVANYDYEGRTL